LPEPTLFGIGKEQWQLINSFAPWLSAIGTLSAVVVSLWLSRRGAPKARLTVGLRIIVGPGSEEPYPEFIVFRIVNEGERPLRITQIGWRWGVWRKQYAVQLFEDAISSKLPVDLAHGQEAQWFVPTQFEDEPWSEHFCKALMPDFRENAYTLRAQVFSSVGKAFEAKPEQALVDRLLDAGHTLEQRQQS